MIRSLWAQNFHYLSVTINQCSPSDFRSKFSSVDLEYMKETMGIAVKNFEGSESESGLGLGTQREFLKEGLLAELVACAASSSKFCFDCNPNRNDFKNEASNDDNDSNSNLYNLPSQLFSDRLLRPRDNPNSKPDFDPGRTFESASEQFGCKMSNGDEIGVNDSAEYSGGLNNGGSNNVGGYTAGVNDSGDYTLGATTSSGGIINNGGTAYFFSSASSTGHLLSSSAE
jgi:hypothetical protein